MAGELYKAIAEAQDTFGLAVIRLEDFRYRLWSEARDPTERRKVSDLAQAFLRREGWQVMPDTADRANCDFFVGGPA